MDNTEINGNIRDLTEAKFKIIGRVKNEGRELTASEQALVDELSGAIDGLQSQLEPAPQRLTVQADYDFGGGGVSASSSVRKRQDGQASRLDYKSMFAQGRSLSNGGFKDASEFLRVIDSGRYDPRLDIMNTMTETTPSEGGFAVPPEFAAEWLDASLPNEITRNLCRVYPMVSETKDIPGWDGADMSSGATHGGFAMTFLGESAQASGQTPKMRNVTLTAKTGSIYVNSSLELTQDARDFETNLKNALVKSIGYGIDRYCISAVGTGAGCPQSVLNAACKIQVSKEGGQSADTLVYQNLKKMFARQLNPQNAVWLFNPNSIPELLEQSVAIGLGGAHVPLLNEKDGKFSIFGRPVYFHPVMPALGEADSAAFVDFSYYALGLRKEVWLDQSDAPRWDYRERSYRVLLRFDGMCTLDQAITPEHGESLSPIVTVEEI